jgi:hypothetical protein
VSSFRLDKYEVTVGGVSENLCNWT